MWKRTTNQYATTPLPTTPYQRAAQVWDDRIGSARVQAKNWRLASLLSIGLSALLAGAFIWQSSQSMVTPYVVEVDTNGAVRAIGPATENFIPSDAQIAHQLADFITNVRSISIDPVVIRQNWLEAYRFATDQAAITLNSYAAKHDPFADIGARSITVDINSIVRSSKDSFDIRWRETSYRGGAVTGTQNHTAILSIIIQLPNDEQTLLQNPIGLYVHGLNWSKDLNSGE